MSKRSPTTKDVGLLFQLFKDSQLILTTEFQRNSVWPRAAKAYLVDTILNDKPIPILFFQRVTSAQSTRSQYMVIDGQQRLRAIFEFLDGRFAITEGDGPWKNKKFDVLTLEQQQKILNYDLIVEELSGYSEKDIRDMFLRMNRYVVKLSPQEMRHAKYHGKFKDFVDRLGAWKIWRDYKIFSDSQICRMKPTEFAAELAVLLIEGPQDKKAVLDLYYGEYREKFEAGGSVEKRLTEYIEWISATIPEFKKSRFRKPTDIYGLIGALDVVSVHGKRLRALDKDAIGDRLATLERQTLEKDVSGDVAKYIVAASRQTDNIKPRTARIEVLVSLLTRV
jgi:hypothetical protein